MFWVIICVILVIIIGLTVNKFLGEPKVKNKKRDHISKLDERNLHKLDEYKKYPSNLYKMFSIHFETVIKEDDGEYQSYALSEAKEKSNPFPVSIKIVSDDKFIGYLLYAPDLYKYLDQHAGCDIFPLFIETIKGKKEAYIYVEKKLLKYNSRNKQEYNHVEDLFFDLEEFTDSDDSIELPIRGINFRNLNNSNIGVFDGYAMPDKNNKYDKYAIGIYNNAGVHYGFIEKGQKDLYNLIEAGKGYVDATLDVTTFVNDMGETKFSGTVTINKNDIV